MLLFVLCLVRVWGELKILTYFSCQLILCATEIVSLMRLNMEHPLDASINKPFCPPSCYPALNINDLDYENSFHNWYIGLVSNHCIATFCKNRDNCSLIHCSLPK